MQFHNLNPDWGWADRGMMKPEPKFGLPDVTPGPGRDKLFFLKPGGYYNVMDTGLPKPSYPGLPRVDGGIGSRPCHPLSPGDACGMPHLPY